MQLHPEGFYEAEILDHGYSKSKTGTDTLVVRFETEHGLVNGYFYLTHKAAEGTIRKIRAMGFAGDDLGELADGAELRGNRCQVQVEHSDYGEQTTARVGWVYPIGYTPGVQRDAEAAAAVKQFNAVLRKEPKQDGAATPAPVGGSDGDVPDDDIPF